MPVIQFLILFIFIIGVILFIISLINQMVYRVPHVSTFNTDLDILRKCFLKYNLEGKKIADLGSGTGKIVRLLEREFQGNAVGYEIDLSNVLISRILNKILKSKAKIIKGNYFKVNLEEYDFLYIYLFPCLMEKVEERLFSHCNKGTIVFVNAFRFKNHKTIEIFYKNGKEKIFVYKVNK